MAKLGTANIGGRAVPAWVLESTAEQVDNSKWFSRSNLLDNPGLDINQCGQSSYDTSKASSYTVDRWWSIFGIYDVTTRIMTSTNQTYGFGFRQPINNPSRFAGKTVTLTAWILSGNGSIGIVKSTGLNSGLSAIGSIPINGPGLYFKTFNIPDDVGSDTYPYMLVSVGAPVGGSLQFASPIPFKLEFGEGQTLAHQDEDGNWVLNEIPDCGEELAKCQAYQVVINTLDIIDATNNATTLYANIPTPVTMRALPAIENNGVFNVRGGGTNQANLTAAIYGSSLNANGIRVGIAGQFTVNEPYHVSIASPIILNANL